MTRISDLASSLAAACLQRSYEDGKTISIPALGIEFRKERESETVSDTEHNDNTFSNELPDTIWAWTNSVGAQKWSDEKIVSHSREYVSAARGDEPEQSDITPVARQVLELVRLADVDGWYDLNLRKLDDGRWYVSARFAGIQPTRGDFTDLSSAVAQLRSRLQPTPPQRPSAEELAEAIRQYVDEEEDDTWEDRYSKLTLALRAYDAAGRQR